MRKCKLCGQSGLLFSLTIDHESGYCPKCLEFEKKYEDKRAMKLQLKKESQRKEWKKIDAIPLFSFSTNDREYKRQTGYERPIFSNITPKGKYNEVVVFDTETTGLSSVKDRIIEIAAIKYIDEKPILKFHSYICPDKPIPEEATKINGITQDMVVDAPNIKHVVPYFDDFVGKAILVAHNLDFDLRFIFRSGSKVLETKRKYIDTLEQAQRILKKPRDVDDYKLDTLCYYYGITMAKEHSALSDAFATGGLFFELVDEIRYK